MASDAFKSALSVVQKKVPTIIKNVNQNNFVKKLQLDSPRLSYAYGGGIKIGAFHRFFGPESGCKSTICTYIGGQFQKHLGEQFPELADHKYVVYCDIERSFDPEHAKENGIDLSEDKFLLLQPLNIEDMALSLEKLIETNQVACVIIDSESFLTTRTINEDEFNKACVSPDTKVDVLFEYEHTGRTGVSISHNKVCEIKEIFKKVGYQDYKKEMKVGELYPIENENFKIRIASMAFGKKIYKPVEYLVYKGEASEGYRVTTPDSSFLATGEHKVYDFDKKEFIELKNIQGNSFFGLDNTNNRVEVKIEKVKESFSILDLQVKETHTYFSGGILSHNTFGTVAKSLKEFCNRFGPLASEYNTTFFIISQERAQMAMMSHAIATTGGYALKYAASTTFRTRKIENLTEGSKVVGIHINCKNYKNKTGVPFRECEMDLYFKGGFNSDGEFIDFIAEFSDDPRLSDLITYSGGYYKSKKLGTTYHGKKAFQDAINDGSFTLWEDVKKTIMDIISNVIDGKENTVDPEDEDQNKLNEEITDNVE